MVLVNEPLAPDAATALIKAIIQTGQVSFSAHATDEIRTDDLTTMDCVNVLRAGAVTESADLENGTWRYRMHTPRMCVVVAFRSEQDLRVVTAWRNRR